MAYTLKHFKEIEFLPKDFTDISVMDERLLKLCDDVREYLGVACSINNYYKGGTRQWCGFRSDKCTVGVAKSQHRLGKAADLHPAGMSADDARAKLKEGVAAGLFPELGAVELGVSWLHVDVRPRVKGKVLYFNA